MDDSSPWRRDSNFSSNKDVPEHNSGRRYSSWEEQCFHDAESDSSSETIYANEQKTLEQKLWISFQNTASAIAQLYKDRAQGSDDTWMSFRNAAEIATNMYRDGVDGFRNMSDLAMQCGYQRRNKEVLAWLRKKRRHLRREDLIGYLCGRSPPHRVSRPSSSLSRSPSLSCRSESPDSRLQTFHDAVSMNCLNGAMAGINFGGDNPLRHTNSPARNCQQAYHPDLTTFISDELKRRNESTCGCSSSRKRSSAMFDHKPSSPKRRK